MMTMTRTRGVMWVMGVNQMRHSVEVCMLTRRWLVVVVMTMMTSCFVSLLLSD